MPSSGLILVIDNILKYTVIVVGTFLLAFGIVVGLIMLFGERIQ